MKSLIRHTTLGLAAFALSATLSTGNAAETPAIDPAATAVLKRACDYVGSLHQFGVYTQTSFEDLTDSGHRVDIDVSARVIVSRPNKVLSQRRGDLINQDFFYDGTNLTLSNPADKVYATVPAPPTIDGTLHYVHDKLGLIFPAGDLVYSNSYALMIEEVTLASVVEPAFIDGVRCDHVLFSRPGVDFQLWVAAEGRPLPMKFVVTDTGTPQLLSISTVMSKWEIEPGVPDSRFTFVPPAGDKPIAFLPLITTGASR